MAALSLLSRRGGRKVWTARVLDLWLAGNGGEAVADEIFARGGCQFRQVPWGCRQNGKTANRSGAIKAGRVFRRGLAAGRTL